jgi:hypothetical protein
MERKRMTRREIFRKGESKEEEEERWKMRRKMTILSRWSVMVSRKQNNCTDFRRLMD